jgi:hypothetical protein
MADFFKYCYVHNYLVSGRLLTNQPKTPMEINTVPIATTTDPFIFQSGLLYIKEDEGPKKLLLWAMKTSPNPTMIPPNNTIIDTESPIFGDTRQHATTHGHIYLFDLIRSRTSLILLVLGISESCNQLRLPIYSFAKAYLIPSFIFK